MNLLIQRTADRGIVPLPQLLAHIHQGDPGQGVLIEPSAQQRQPVISLPGMVSRFHRRGGRAQHQPGALLGAAVFGYIPGMVAGRFLRLVRPLLLLIQHNHTQIVYRSKHRRPGTQHDLHQPLPDALILVIPLGNTQAAVQQCHILAEMQGKTLHHLGCQGNFRHQDHSRSALLQQLLRKSDVHLRLAAAGNPLQKRYPGLSAVDLRQNIVVGRLLLIIELNLRRFFLRRAQGYPKNLLLTQGKNALLPHFHHPLALYAGVINEVVERGLSVFQQKA